MSRRRIGVFGGTFDPVHSGHVAAAQAAQTALGLDLVYLVPAARPPHRTDSPRASGYHRFAMVALAVAGSDGWRASDLELARGGPSYTYDTLTALAGTGLAPPELFFITGLDAFAEVTTWSRYPAVLDLAHFVVVSRPSTALRTGPSTALDPFDALGKRLPGLVPRMIPVERADEPHEATRIVLLPAATPDVSSTDIRARAARGEPLAGFVPPAVETHIRQHGLYRSA